jgi:hypothetical protein
MITIPPSPIAPKRAATTRPASRVMSARMRTSALRRPVVLVLGAMMGLGACSSGTATVGSDARDDGGTGGGGGGVLGGGGGGSAGSSPDAALAIDGPLADQAADGCCDGSTASDASDASDASVATMVTIPGTANLWGAGHALPPDPSGHGPGTLPPVVDLPAGTGRTMTVTRMSGAIDFDGPEPALPEAGGDGLELTDSPPIADSASVSLGGIAGPLLPACPAGGCSARIMFLGAVFLDATEPVEPPPPPYPIAMTEAVLDGVGLRQTFYVGDGWNGPYMGIGVVQTFKIPDGATRVFFGFFDFYGPGGAVGSYSDNTGQLKATVTISR